MILLTAVCLFGPVFNAQAQYTKLVKGEPSPYDTAVAVRVDVYRLETQKMVAADKVIAGQRATIDAQMRAIENAQKKSKIDAKTIKELEAQVEQDAIIKEQLHADYVALEKIANKRPSIFKSPKLWAVLGFATGALIFF